MTRSASYRSHQSCMLTGVSLSSGAAPPAPPCSVWCGGRRRPVAQPHHFTKGCVVKTPARQQGVRLIPHLYSHSPPEILHFSYGGFGGGQQGALTAWITQHCKTVPASSWQSSS